MVIGAGGAGKTTLACTLGRVLDLPVVHLDAHYFGPGWRPLPPAEWETRQGQLLSGRRWWAGGRRRPATDLPAGLHHRLERQFLAYVLGFRRRRRPALLAELARWSQHRTVVILRSRRAIRQFVDQLPSPGR